MSDSEGDANYKCHICKVENMTHNEWKDHYAEDQEHLDKVKAMQLKRFFCTKCDHQFENERLFNRHCESKKHKFGQLTKEQLFCQKCNTQCQNKASWDDHILTKKHLSTKVELTKEQLYCKKCEHQFENERLFNRHCESKKHQFGQLTVEQLFCKKCNTQCQNKAKWDEHILTKKHNKVTPGSEETLQSQ